MNTAPHAVLGDDIATDAAAETFVAPLTGKIIVAGGFGVGKTTFVGAISEIAPLRTEEVLTLPSIGVDDTSLVPDKNTTTVAMDFGRVSIDDGLILYLFGTPGQDRFHFMWDQLCRGAIGAIVLADTRRLAECWDAVDYMDNRGLAYVVALNLFADAPTYDVAEVRQALRVPDHVPLLTCDARDRSSVQLTLITLVEHVLSRHRSTSPRTTTP